jgi:hypothetical protein
MKENYNTGVIYCVENIITNKKYIGQAMSYLTTKGKKIKHGLEGRLKKHFTDANNKKMCCPKFYNSIIKYGQDSFKAYVLEICNLDELNDNETHYINKYNTVEDGYNIVYSNGNNIKKYDDKIDMIKKISNTMKDKWKNNKEYIKKTNINNLKAVCSRALSGKTRKSNINLPHNIYKTEKGYDIRIMRNGIYKITSVENNLLSDKELLNNAIQKRDKLITQLNNNTVENFEKKLDHNGNKLPIGIHRRKARNQEAYAIKLIINKKAIGKCVSNSKLSMDEKLEKAIKLLNEIKILYKIK